MGTKFRGGLIFTFFVDSCVIVKFYHHENLFMLVTPTIHVPINRKTVTCNISYLRDGRADRMALLRFFHPVGKEKQEFDPNGPLSIHVPSRVISSINEEPRKDISSAPKCRGEYTKMKQEEKAKVAKYASENGVAKALRHFKEMNLKETSVRDLKKLYEKELKSMRGSMTPGTSLVVNTLPSKKCGRPPLVGEKADDYLQKLIIAMRERGAPIGTSVVVGIGHGVLLKMNKACLGEFGGTVNLNKEWAKSVLCRMGFTKRRANSKSKVIPDDFVLLKEQCLLDIRTVALMGKIPADLVVNWDQTAMKIVPSCSCTMERKGTKQVEIAAIEDKRQITAVFGCSLSGNFLPLQLIYEGTTQRCLPKGVPFPSDWHITCTANHWSNGDTMVDYVQKVVIPYIVKEREEPGLSADHCALAIFDVFK